MATNTHLTIHKVVAETADTISIHFQQPWHKMIDYKAGQYLTLIATIDGKQVRRPYSLCSSPHADAFPAVAVKRIPGGEMSNFLADWAAEGKGLEIMEPMGNFFYEPAPEKRRHIVLFAAGSGITPMFSIIKSALKMEPKSEITLVYGNRNVESIIFHNELTELQGHNSNRLRVVHCLTSPPDQWYGATGRISQEMLGEILEQTTPALPIEDSLYFMCGPQGMMDSVQQVLISRGVPATKVFHESFFSNVSEVDKEAAIVEQGIIERTVKVIYDGDEFEFTVPAHSTILEAAEEADVDLPYSCQSGLCTACRGKCLSGKIHMDETEGLSQNEIENGYILTCVGHPLTDNVVIEIG
jgi:ring-1,2-phenylacetyl-CoA epoxidase subunit PaaE